MSVKDHAACWCGDGCASSYPREQVTVIRITPVRIEALRRAIHMISAELYTDHDCLINAELQSMILEAKDAWKKNADSQQ
jgi:hypothetical protein